MKKHKSIVDSRRNKVMIILQKQGRVLVDDLVAELQVSPLTIRRDLQYWEEQNAIERFYGGAKLVNSIVDCDDPTQTNALYKHAIAKYAAQYVKEGDTIFINTSSTALLVLKYIRNKRCTVITNNGKAIFEEHDPLISIVLTGGELRIPKESMVGEFALNNLNRVSANKAFIGCSGINVTSGITTAILQEVAINETMVNRTNGQVFVLADHTKVGNQHSFISGSIDKVTYLITDQLADDTQVSEIENSNVTVVKLKPLLKIENN